jgi:anti-sigma B factor antagonist
MLLCGPDRTPVRSRLKFSEDAMTDSMRGGTDAAEPAHRRSEESPLTITVEAQGNEVVMRVTGEIDLVTGERWRDALQSVVADATAQRLVVDLSDVSFISSEGIGTLVVTQQKLAAQGGRLDVVASKRSVIRPIELLGLATLFNLRSRLSGS